jgi:outer membrane protein assembly factor BamB
VEQELGRLRRPGPPKDWPLFRGDPARAGQGHGTGHLLEPRWHNETVRTGTTRSWLEEAARFTGERHLPLLPAAVPITATVSSRGGDLRSLVIYRSHWGVHAVSAGTGKLEWETASNWSLDRMSADANKASPLANWVKHHLEQLGKPDLLLANSSVGTLSTDGIFVYLVEDLAVPPPLSQVHKVVFDREDNSPFGRFGQSVADAVQHSKLQGFNLIDGKLKWEAGGKSKPDREARELEDRFFLGPPLPLGGRLYAMVETKVGNISLACLHPRLGKLLWTQKLAAARTPLPLDTIRRSWAAPLAYADGILVCPTNDGTVFGVDLLTHTPRWAHIYRHPAPPPLAQKGGVPRWWELGPDGKLIPPGQPARWHYCAPVLGRGKVLLTAPDGEDLVCLDLKTGEQLWAHKQQPGDLYLAGVAGDKVLVVGSPRCRALGLADGKTAWTLETGIPSGLGALADGLYHLPLRRAARTQEPEVCVLDVARGEIAAHHRIRNKEVCGNLLFVQGEVLSQTTTQLTRYPTLQLRPAQIEELLRKNPHDVLGLCERAALRRNQGNLAGAAEDLKAALKQELPPDLEARLKAELSAILRELRPTQ